MNAWILPVYFVLVLGICGFPRFSEEPVSPHFLGRGRNVLSGVFALLSTLCLPWCGVSLAEWVYPAVGSAAWLPLFALSLLLQVREREGIMSLLLTLALAFAFISFFMLKAGIPGKLGSLEGMSIATHLQGIHSPLFGVAWGLFALAGVWVFVRMNPLPEGIARLVAFSYSGMLLIVFAPISFGISTLRYDPGAKLLVSGVISFVLAGLFCHALTGFQHTEVRQKRRMIGEAIPLLLVFVAGCLLYISRFG